MPSGLTCPIEPGARGDWIKVKCVQRESFFIIGYEGNGTRKVSRLLLGAYRGDKVVYVGDVGTGFTDREASSLRELMGLSSRSRSPRSNAIARASHGSNRR